MTTLAHGPTVSLGLTKWLLHPRCGAAARGTICATRDSPWSSSSRSEDFREGLSCVQRAAPFPTSRDGDGGHRRAGLRDRASGRRADRSDPPMGGGPCARGLAPRRQTGRRLGHQDGPHVCRLRGLVPGLCRVRSGSANMAGGIRRGGALTLRSPCRRGRVGAVQLGSPEPLGSQSGRSGPLLLGTEEQRLRSSVPSCATRRSGASCSASRGRVRIWHRWPPGPSVTATSG